MKMQLQRFSIIQSSKIATILYVIFGFLYTLIGIPIVLFAEGETKIMGIFYLFGPIWMGFFGFILVVITLAIYNGLASIVGGIEFELAGTPDVPGSVPPRL